MALGRSKSVHSTISMPSNVTRLINEMVVVVVFLICQPVQYNCPAILRVATIEGCLVNYCIIIISFPAVKQTFLNGFFFSFKAANPCSYQSNCIPGYDCKNLFGNTGGTTCVPCK